jgi:hypothetical protein
MTRYQVMIGKFILDAHIEKLSVVLKLNLVAGKIAGIHRNR